MRTHWWFSVLAAVAVWPIPGHSEDLAGQVKKAVEQSTLNQPGTKPFHLKAMLAPSFERDKDSGQTGEVEIWWESPTRWKREVRSPEFHQIEIVDGDHDWQKNDGNYFPEWLRDSAVELTNPAPLEPVLEGVKTAEVRRLMGQITLSWITNSGTADARNILRSVVTLQESTGLLLYAYGLGWGADFHDYKNFHGRKIAQTVNVGTPQVTAKVTVLEDLGQLPSGFFDATATGADAQPLRTIVVDETSLRKNLLPMEPISWPPLQDGPLEGNVTTEIVVDREGKAREIGPIVSENSGVNDTGKQAVAAMRFKPFVANEVAVQVLSQVTVPFKTVRPAGVETFESARNYFERGRRVGFPAAGNATPYLLHAEFGATGTAGTIQKGRYEDTWLSDNQWRREAWFDKSQYVRSRNVDQRYQLEEGPDVALLRLALKILEPIPAIDTFTESDWKIKRDTVDGTRTVRVLTGYESPEGKLDPESARGYWFDDAGLLVKTYFKGVETRRSDFEDFHGAKMARLIDVLKDGRLGMRIHITEVKPSGPMPATTFELPGHDWERAFTEEVR